MVKNNILISNKKERLSTYQTSYSNFCCQEMAFLPFTCAHPVIPGQKLLRFFCVSLYKGKYCINNGLGPIKLISPFNTLSNCGISSKEVFRTKLPTLVKRSPSGSRFPFLSFLSFIDLNLIILNIFSFLPGRF